LTRSVHTSLDSPIETQTSVCTKSAPDTASLGSSVSVIRAPVRGAISRATPYGFPLASCIVRKSASIWVGCHSSVRPLYTGTPAYSASSSTSVCRFPRNSIASYIRPSTRAVSATDSL
jgi:hypothetical protein